MRLTIDLDSQQIAEESLIQGMDGARSLVDPDSGNYYEANAGAVVVLDARTGSVVAMASNPSFNPNDFISGNADQYFKDPNNPLINRALNALRARFDVQDVHVDRHAAERHSSPRGRPHRLRESRRLLHVRQRERRALQRGKAVLGTVDLPSALTVSSDVYFYTVGNEFWNAYRDEGKAAGKTGDLAGDDIPDAQHPVGNAIQHTAGTYGFGESTGMGLGDQSGVIPDHEYRVKLNQNDAELQFWRRGDSASLAVGQGDVLVTPLQLANAYAAFANGGTLFTAATRRRGDPEQRGLPPGQLGPVVRAVDPPVKRSTGLTPEVASPIEAGLARRGRPQRSWHRGRRRSPTTRAPQVIGKTGTARAHGGTQAGHVVVRRHHQSRQRPGAAAVRGRGDGRAGRLRRQRRRADRAPGHRLPQRNPTQCPRRSWSAPATGTESRATDVDHQPEPHRARPAAPRARRAVAARGVAAAPLRLAARRRGARASPRSGC